MIKIGISKNKFLKLKTKENISKILNFDTSKYNLVFEQCKKKQK